MYIIVEFAAKRRYLKAPSSCTSVLQYYGASCPGLYDVPDSDISVVCRLPVPPTSQDQTPWEDCPRPSPSCPLHSLWSFAVISISWLVFSTLPFHATHMCSPLTLKCTL